MHSRSPTSPRFLAMALLAAPLLAACGGRAAPRASRGPAAAPPAARDSAGHPLTGLVRDDRSDAPVPDAFLLLLADTAADAPAVRVGRTDARGRYRLAGDPAGRYFVRIRRLGYVTETRAVQLGECPAIVVSGTHVSYCADTRHFYLHASVLF